MGERFRVDLPAQPEALSSMRGVLRRWLRHLGAGDQEIAEVVTACGEAATNAIEHSGTAGGEPFEVSAVVHAGEVRITIRDYGAWREPREGDHGRGLSLMKALMDSVSLEPTPEGTTVRLTRALRGTNGGPE
jgi:anti-sigma regulatory factor (Ser/Thr protein kinase)